MGRYEAGDTEMEFGGLRRSWKVSTQAGSESFCGGGWNLLTQYIWENVTVTYRVVVDRGNFKNQKVDLKTQDNH